MPRRIASACVLAGAIGLGLLFAGPGGSSAGAAPSGPPNFVVFLTDDQPAKNMGPLQRTRELLSAEGATFRRAYVTYPLCCPSRATLLTGQYMHNHLVRGNGPPYGGWRRFRDLGAEASALPARLADEGYYSIHIGKYMNGYSALEGLQVPPGWDEWYGRLGGELRSYYDYTLLERGPSGVPAMVEYGSEEPDYSTDVFAGKALDFIERAPSIGQPFFLNLSFGAAHHPFTPAKRDEFTLAGGILPVRVGFNERDFEDKPRWLQRAAPRRFGPGWRRKIANEQRRRDETLLAVDNAVEQVVTALDQQGLLENTYLIFTSDNGLFRGEHRLTGGKYLPHEPSSHVPLIIRGPSIPAGVRSRELVANIDIPATILALAGAADPTLDGRSLAPFALNPSRRTTRPILLEGDTGPGRGIGSVDDPDLDLNGGAAGAGLAGLRGVNNLDQEKRAGARGIATGDRAPAYRAIRTDRYLYVLYATGDVELYDMARDPGQLQSLARSPRYERVRDWLRDRLLERFRCRGAACRAPIGTPPPPAARRR